MFLRWLFWLQLAVLCVSQHASANAMQLPNVQWNVGYQNRSLNEVLTEVLTPSGYAVQISPQVAGTVSGRLKGSLTQVFDTLVRTFGLTWYFERGILYVYTAAESRSQMIKVERASIESVKSSLEQLGLADRRFELRFDARNRTLIVTGPPRWVEVVTAVAQSADESSSSPQAAELRVFPLRYARASDRIVGSGEGQTVLPGVVTLLQQMYGLKSQLSTAPQGNSALYAARSGRDTGNNIYRQFLSTTGRLPTSSNRQEASTDGQDSGPVRLANPTESRSNAVASFPQIQPDVRTNSVLIRDFPQRMASHDAVIRQLDVPTRMIEIEAAIIEINSDVFDSLGIDWRLSTRRFDLQTGSGTTDVLRRSGGNLGAELDARTSGLGAAAAAAASPRGLVSVMAAGNLVNQVLARVSALEGTGQGRVLSKPKIVTPENMEALIESTATYYVKLQGNLEVSLADVTVGTKLKVFPTIEGSPGAPGVKLAIRIEDGSISSSLVETLPVVQRNAVTTEAVVGLGQTLVVGGMTVERDSGTINGVPGLSRVPLVGRLFQNEGTRRERMERIFLLTPRIVELTP